MSLPDYDFTDCIASPFVVGQRIRQIQCPHAHATVTEITDHGFKYKFDIPQTVGRHAWGWTTDGGEVFSRHWYPHGGFENVEPS